MRFSDVDIDLETLTSMELKDFIRQGIDYINELYKHNESEGIRFKKPQQHFFDEIQSNTARGRFGSKLGYGVTVNKEKLLDKANDIMIFLKLQQRKAANPEWNDCYTLITLLKLYHKQNKNRNIIIFATNLKP